MSLHDNRYHKEFLGPRGKGDYVGSEVLLQSLHISEPETVKEEELYSGGSNKSLKEDADEPPRLMRSATSNSIYASTKKAVASTQASNGNSRNNSPRPNEAKLRPGAAARTAPQRSSVNYTSTSLQEDLIKLINPDFASDDNFHSTVMEKKSIAASHSLGNIAQMNVMKLQPEEKTRSRDDVAKAKEDEVIFTTARPATVVSVNGGGGSSTGNGIGHANLSTSDLMSSKLMQMAEEKLKLSPRKVQGILKNGPTNIPLLPDMNEMDWNTLVDTATRAMMQVIK